MQKSIVSGFVAVGVAAAIIVPSTYEAHGQANSPERISPAVSQSTDRADARIAILKADLGLTPEQAQHWSGLQSALHDIAVRRAKMWVASSELQTGRASSSSPATSDSKERDASLQRSARRERPDDIDEMRKRADAFTIEAADLRQIADAAQPLYDTLDDRQRHRLVQFVREDMRANAIDNQRGRHHL
ncbi:MAG: hypothetical protein WA231_14905 [Methylocella sp.]